jgi:CHAT domain-containing protein
VIEAFQLMRQAVEQLLQAQVLRRTKEVWLLGTQGVTARAAYAFAMSGRAQEAVEALEEGQARLLSETLALSRNNLESLRGGGHHALYERFRETVEAWENGRRDNPEALPRLHRQLQELTLAVRAIPGHETFLKSSGIGEIARAAAGRVLVYIAATSAGGLALLVHSQSERVGVRANWLPELSSPNLQAQMQGEAGGYLDAYRQWQQAPEDAALRRAWFGRLDALGRWLWRAVVAPILGSLAGSSRITLVPCGGLALLPLHIAWMHDERNDARQYLGDLATIGYAPNARAVIVAAGRLQDLDGATARPAGLVVVHTPDNPDLPALPGTPHEASAVQSFFDDALVLQGAQATKENLLNAMAGREVAHLASHGRANLDVPLDSGLLLADGDWLTVADLLNAPPQPLRLVSLSACETAMPGTLLPDEVVGLPGGVLAAGACGVVASLWSVSDASTLLLMSRFYERWRAGGQAPDVALAAAQSWLRAADNAALLGYVRSAVTAGRMTEQAYRLLRTSIGFQPMDGRPFEHPFYWGAFCYVGV